MTDHECPYDGVKPDDGLLYECGHRGALCDRCREDLADARALTLIRGMVASGLLANPETAKLPSPHIKRGIPQRAADMARLLAGDGG